MMSLLPPIVCSSNFLKAATVFLFALLAALIPHSPCLAQTDEVGRLVHFKGEVTILSSASSGWQKALAGQVLHRGDTIQTGKDSRAFILLSDESLLQLNSETRIHLREVAQTAGWHRMPRVIHAAWESLKSVYQLLGGEIWLRNKNDRANIEIETRTFTVGVRGTELNLSVAHDELTTLSVLRGMVQAWNDQGSLDVLAGEQALAKPGTAPRKKILLSPQDAVQWTISIPPLFTHRDFSLVTGDRNTLQTEQTRLEGLLRRRPQDPGVLVQLGKVYRDAGHPLKAEECFAAALNLKPQSREALVGLGWTFLDRDEPARALPLFQRASPKGPFGWLGMSVAYGQLGMLDDAAVAAQEGMRRNPEFVPLQVQMVFILLQRGELEHGHAQLIEITRRHPEDAPAWRLLAVTSLARGEKTSALKASTEAVSRAPFSPNALIVQSYAYQANFDLHMAIEASSRAVALDETNVDALLQLASLQFGTDYVDRAWDTAQRAYGLDPASGEVQNLMGFLQLARRKTKEAVVLFSNASKEAPELGEPHLGLGIAAMRLGDEPTAMREISTAVLLEPRRSLFLSYWGKMLYQLERFDEALDILSYAGELDPQDPTPELYKGIILRDLFRPTEALDSLNRSIQLNDNRAVYRSRFLLDQDLAVKNVNLSIVYDQLGLSSWAAYKALNSIKQDYTNYSAHLFLAGAYSSTGIRLLGQGSEALLARLLQPATENALNRFNEYTSFFERPSINGIADGFVGSQDTHGGDLIVYGAYPELNLAYSAAAFYSSTDGWRDTNTERSKSVAGIFKYDPTPKDGISFSPRYLTLEQGDEIYPRTEYDSPSDPLDWNDARQSRFELGYHHHFGPNTDLLLFFTRVTDDGTIYSHDRLADIFGIPGLNFESLWDLDYEVPYYQGQAQGLFKVGDHQFILGTVHYSGENNSESIIDTYFDFGGFIFFPERDRAAYDTDQRLHSYYAQDIWQVTPDFIVEAALFYDTMKNSNAISGNEWRLDEWGPRLGLIWQPTPSDTLRLAGFRYLLPFTANRLDPMDIAGVPIFRNAGEGSISKEADFIWQHEWASGFFSTNLFYLRRKLPEEFTLSSGDTIQTLKSQIKGVELNFNQLLCSGVGLSGRYEYLDVDDDNLPQNERIDHLATAGLRWVLSSGFSAFVAQSYRHIDFKNRGRSDEDIWLTDAGVEFEFPGRRGNVAVQMNNIFDEQFNWVEDIFSFRGRAPAREVLLRVAVYF